MRILLLTFGLLITPLFHAAAQVSVEVTLDELEFLRDESLVVKVRIVNRSGQPLKFGQTTDWLSFTLQSQDGHNVERIGDVPVTGEFTVESSQTATKSVDLMPWFAFPQPGRYSVVATVKIPQWRDDFVSAPKSFHIIRGARVWEQEFGVPRKEGVPEVRQYSLLRASGMKKSRLYLRVSDQDDTRVFRVTSLGQVVSFGKPEAQVDRLSKLHVLLQNGPRSFTYAVFDPNGDWVTRQTFEYTESRPVLRVNDTGHVLVAGGQRRFSPSDFPPSTPVGVPAEGTNNSATDLNTNRATLPRLRLEPMAGLQTVKGIFHVVRAVPVLVAVGILWCSAGVAQEVQVMLRNGDRLTGTLVTEDALRLTLTNGLLGRFVVPTALIERRVLVGTPAVPKPPAKPTGALTGGPPSPAATDTTIVKRIAELEDSYRSNKITSLEYHRERSKLVARMDTTNGIPSRVPSANATAIVPPRPPVKFNGEIQAGLDLAFATKDRQLYSSRMKLVHTQSPLRNTADFSFTYGRVEGDVSANRMEGMLKTDYDLTRRLYLYNLGGGGYDEIRKLDNYFQIGPGVGDRLVKMTNYLLNVEGGANFQRQLRSDGTETDIFYYRLAQESKLSLGQKLTFDERFEYFPQWNNFGEYRIRFEANLKYFLRGNLFLNLTMIDLYDTMPGKGVDSNDLQIRSAIGMKF